METGGDEIMVAGPIEAAASALSTAADGAEVPPEMTATDPAHEMATTIPMTARTVFRFMALPCLGVRGCER
ncbi:hypothetical protein GCM10027200_49550 [Lentzea nigeriaca]